MYLSHLDITGFKSFAQRTQLKFQDGITAIVGPNGCGKTNIVDAMRWVLGEQKSSVLRSDSMSDIIFNGTKHRKPLGMVEVSMTVQNTKGILPTEYTEVTITRRLFRSGESEYLLNKTKCRLRDITDLFMDTGMGADAYSVIELKMIETILDNRASERRHLFEEAAGVTKYKIRRKEAERKLVAVQSDVARVNDIILEVQKNVKTLQRQATRAENYKSLATEIAELERVMILHEYAGLRQEFAPLAEAIHTAELRRNNSEQALSSKEHHIKDQENILHTAESQFSEAEIARAEVDRAFSTLRQECAVASERLQALERALERLHREKNDFGSTISSLERGLEQAREKFSFAQASKTTAERDFHEKKSNHEILQKKVVEFRTETRAVSGTLVSVMNNINSLRQAEERTMAQIESLARRIEEVHHASAQSTERAEQLHLQIEQATKGIPTFQEAIQAAEQELATAQDRQKHLQEESDHFKQVLADKQAERSQKAASLEFLSGLVDTNESTVFLMKNSEWQTPEKRLLLAEALSTDDAERVAVEAALGDAAKFFIVESRQEASLGMSALQKSDKGKATFICLENVPEIAQPEALHNESGIIGWASEIIRANDAVRNIVRGLLGKTLIVDSLETAWSCIERNVCDCAVTTAGEIVRHNGAILRGGSKKITEGAFIGKQEKIQLLREQIALIDTEISSLRTTIQQMTTEFKNINIRLLSENVRRAESDKARHEQTIAQLHFKREQELQSSKRFLDQAEQYTREREILKEKSGSSHDNIAQYSQQKTEIEAKISDLQTQLKDAESELDKAVSELRRSETSLLTITNEERVASSDIDRLTNQIENMKRRRASSTQELETISADITSVTEVLKEKTADRDMFKLRSEEAHTRRNSIHQHVLEIRKTLDALRRELKEVRDEHDIAIREHHALELRKSTIENKMNSLKQRAEEEFRFDAETGRKLPPLPVQTEDTLETTDNELTDKTTEESSSESVQQIEINIPEVEENNDESSENVEALEENFVPFEPDEFFNIESARETLRSKKKQLQNYGAVNLMAAEEFTKESERQVFLEAQIKDLRDAETTLLQTISEINTTAQKQFNDTFAIIRRNFIDIFKSLFEEGDEADLLIEEGDPLEAPIEIIAKPRGKRPHSIDMLSGGEKTLTATALLFAIYLVKPSPFCILDEVDAPLDDANVQRFVRLIRRFSGDTQFIVVTHNKRTMEAADTLFGVTMEEEGVSRLVSVQFTKKSAA